MSPELGLVLAWLLGAACGYLVGRAITYIVCARALRDMAERVRAMADRYDALAAHIKELSEP